jgi:3-oxoacyl-[acyl-carrier-protein] synthase-3
VSLRIDWLDIFSYAGEMETCMYAGAVKQADGSLKGWQHFDADAIRDASVMAVMQDVKLLHEEVVRHTVEKPLVELTARRGLRAAAIDYFLPHYSSLYFRDKLHAGMQASGLDIPLSRWFTASNPAGTPGPRPSSSFSMPCAAPAELPEGSACCAFVPRAAASRAPSCT